MFIAARAQPRRAAAAELAVRLDPTFARAYAAEICRTMPRYTVADFLGSFLDARGASLFSEGARRIGMA